jgi:precorrin-2 dehydrogenase / sirohydrochlorin ferrochelatase
MDAFPAFFPLTGREVVVVGEGEAAEAKARLFDGAPAVVRRVPPAEAADSAAYRGAALAFVALPGAAAETAARAARSAGVPVNVVDRPELCDFTTPAIVDRGAVIGAIGTGGAAPVLATLLRSELEAVWPEDLGERAALAAELQAEIRATLPELKARRAFLRELLRGPSPDAAEVRRRLAAFEAPSGRLVEIAAGGPAERLRLADVRLLAQADVIAAEPGCDPAVLAFARRDAERAAPDLAALSERAAAGALVVFCEARSTP